MGSFAPRGHLGLKSPDEEGQDSIQGTSRFELSGCNGQQGTLASRAHLAMDFQDIMGRWIRVDISGRPIEQVGIQ